ncbi:hypothetical protein HFP89_09275 [Wenzhouxiangella sp. XN79A]|uniref:hypothetical protein n=1 Tax=Wenzhouxiangella sp. XN79A TaxID=2724193 RepID=UPI00144AACD8|nr:hypothetical protein [Wenzhouxiangella sp. XN79A]NKI35358.1 hypothetical protein [Wenzhouxiangella sp. XN79A]
MPFAALRDRLVELRVSLRKRQEADLITPSSTTALTWPRFLKRAGISRPVMIIPRDTGEWVDVESAVFGLITNQPEIGHHAGQVFDADEIVVLELP